MRLKRLSIKGFKSFADETDIHFNENLIGIVGPNGSGKSNVVDAIRWVLGEGKKSELRLADMKDIIFSGTKDRKEGRVARVTLSFDNTKNILPTDYNEVSITRILYRDGTSEYRLNNVPCRKKDIMNLFVDSGIGSNSYAIISLNMVEDILHDNGGYRRQMIEQAAGISKYKIRKKETLNKLRATEEDLDRVKDLLFEIEKNMLSFERQAKRTERFNKLKEEYKEISIKLSHIEVKEFSIRFKELSEQLTNEKDKRIHLNTSQNQKEAALAQLKAEILKYEKSLNVDQQAYNELIEKLGRVENDKNLSIQRLTSSQDRAVEIERSTADLGTSMEMAEKRAGESEQLRSESKGFLEIAQAQTSQSSEHYDQVAQRYEDLRTKEKEIKNEIQANQQLKESLGREIESLSTRKTIINTDIITYEERIKGVESQGEDNNVNLTEQEVILSAASSKVAEAETTIASSEETLSKLNEELSKQTVSKNKIQAEHSSLEQRIKFLTNIIDNHEGVPEAVKWVLEEVDNGHEIVSDIISIKDEQYTKIVELYLEPYFHYLITENHREAEELYKKVREGQKGKLHLFVLDDLNEIRKTDHYNDLIALKDLIKVDQKYQSIIDFLCEGVYVSKGKYDLIGEKYKTQDITILYPDDFLVTSKGHLYGGSNTLFEGVQLGRKKILEGIEDKSLRLASKLKEAEETIYGTKQLINSHHNEVRHKRQAIAALRSDQEKEQRNLYQIENTLRNQKENINQLRSQIEIKIIELAKTTKALSEKELRWEDLKSLRLEELSDEELTSEIEIAHKDYIAKGREKEDFQRSLFEAKSQFDIASKDVEYHRNSINSIAERLGALKSEITILKDRIETESKHSVDFKSELEVLYAEKAELQKKLSSYEDTYYKEKGKIFELEKSLTELRSKLSRKDVLINSLTEKSSTLQFEIKSIHERNSIEFGIEIKTTEFPEEYEGVDLEALREKRTRINQRIRNYGEINPMAITAYNEVKERHDNISKERDDIVTAMTSLQETIAEIEKTASERFNKALDDIRVNFRKVFQGLFSDGDDCDIVLLDAEDPLSANIEIIAKPKGKRPKSISQLSGGEKTLTAASFLFALYLLKPAPFCIFDEVDAPLDDVNVLKFNKIIRQFSSMSQFIVITHNKLTMAEVDVLYGVYLKDQGVSGVSAVDFRSYEDAETMAPAE